jgi:hypothetical protein
MLLPLLLMLAPDPETAIDAERAFNLSAQTEGQWTAFRKFSTPDALLFTPQPAKAHEILPLKDPPITVQWWPAESYVSCDGTMAVNTGPWVRPDSMGYFTTVWVRQTDGRFKWVYDAGDALAVPRPLPENPKVRTASCIRPAAFFDGDWVWPPCPENTQCDHRTSGDGTLHWSWTVKADGSRSFVASLWNGKSYDVVVRNDIAAQ